MKKKINNNQSDKDRAVSPVIGVILMVAITVILAAVIAAFVLDLGQGQSTNVNAGIDFDQSGDDVSVQVINEGNADEIYVRLTDSSGDSAYLDPDPNDNDDVSSDRSDIDSWGVGDRVTFDSTNVEAGSINIKDGEGFSGDVETITVIGTLDGQDQVIQTYTP